MHTKGLTLDNATDVQLCCSSWPVNSITELVLDGVRRSMSNSLGIAEKHTTW